MTIAFLYNIRHLYPDPDDPRSHLEADFDDPGTIKWIIRHLKRAGFAVIPIEADDKAYLKLYRNRKRIDLALNYSEGIYGRDREAHLPAMLEMLKIPYTGSRPLTQAIGLNKAKTKEILLANGVPTLPFQVFKTGEEKLEDGLDFPLIVKPIAQGSSAGITNQSVVDSKKRLRRQIAWVVETFNQPALVEPFLSGREFSVGLLGNPPEFLPLVEADHSLLPEGFKPLDSLAVKWHFEEESDNHHLRCPARVEKRLLSRIKDICRETWEALCVTDYCRIDLRCDEKNNPFVLEINSPPGLLPPEVSTTSYFPLMARKAGIEYPNLLKKMVGVALERYRQTTS